MSIVVFSIVVFVYSQYRNGRRLQKWRNGEAGVLFVFSDPLPLHLSFPLSPPSLVSCTCPQPHASRKFIACNYARFSPVSNPHFGLEYLPLHLSFPLSPPSLVSCTCPQPHASRKFIACNYARFSPVSNPHFGLEYKCECPSIHIHWWIRTHFVTGSWIRNPM